MKRTCILMLLLGACLTATLGQSAASPEGTTGSGGDPGAKPLNKAQTSPEFLQAADEVMAEMSKLIDLPIKEPLKKSLRSKDEIRAFIVQEDKEDKDEAQKYADGKSMEAFGLIPRGFPIDSFMEDVLTDEIAGLYDPKGKEFYIADWIPAAEQKDVMSHELTHALEDQSFGIDSWIKAARPNDDGELARDSVSEGSAMAAMLDYALRDQKISVRDLPNVAMLLEAGAAGEMDKDPKLATAPIYIRDSLLFPYLAGVTFTQQFLKAHAGWGDLHLIFEHPPVSTQQIMHPEKYLSGVEPVDTQLPDWKGLAPADWKLLEENVLGEFGVQEVLKQYLGADAAGLTSPGWAADRYAVFEDKKDGTLPLVFVLDMDNAEDAARFFGQYSSALEDKYKTRSQLFRRTNFFQFQTDGGWVFVRVMGTRCLVVEEASRETFDKIDRAIGWPDAPVPGNESPKAAPGVVNGRPGFSSSRNAALAAIN